MNFKLVKNLTLKLASLWGLNEIQYFQALQQANINIKKETIHFIKFPSVNNNNNNNNNNNKLIGNSSYLINPTNLQHNR
jgi:hypothetical protein